MENERDTTLPGSVICCVNGGQGGDLRKQFQDDQYFTFQDNNIYSFQ